LKYTDLPLGSPGFDRGPSRVPPSGHDVLGSALRGEGLMTPEDVVRAEMGAWSSLDVDQIMGYFTDDATWLPGFSFPTYSGLKEIRGAVEGFVKDMARADIEIVNLAVAGNVVLTERIDRFIFKGEPLDAPGMGAFEVSGDKITAWRDYFAPET
jgi:limonene-1,2-epoxide hydrolase